MIPLGIIAKNVRSYAELEFDFHHGVTALVGENGAGKSTIVDLVDVALFADGARDLAPLLRRGETELLIAFDFEHAGVEYHVERAYSSAGRGKTRFDLVALELDGPIRAPLSRETTAATQAELERILGFTRETFRASVFCAQGDGTNFCDAQPRDRRALLSAILHLEVWDGLLAGVRDDLLAARQDESRLSLEAAPAVALAGQLQTLRTEALAAAERRRESALALEQAEHALEAFREFRAEAALAVTERAHAEAARANALAAVQRAEQVAVARSDAAGQRSELLAETGMLALVAEHLEEHRKAYMEAQTVDARRTAALQNMNRLRSEWSTLLAEADDIRARRERMEHENAGICERCGQTLGAEAAAKVATTLHEEELALRSKAQLASAEASMLEVPEVDGDIAILRSNWQEADDAHNRMSEIRGRVSTLEALLKQPAPDVHDAHEAVAQATARLEALPEPAPAAGDEHDLAGQQAERKRAHGLAIELETMARHRLGEAHEATKRLDALRHERTVVAGRLALLKLEQRAYSRTGVPALILEAVAVPRLESFANEILERWESADRVELRTLRELKTGGLAESLDVVCVTAQGERPFETFSGGERTRIALALRLALARLMRADCGLLVIDEPEGLDAAGMLRLPGLLETLGSEYPVSIVVAHNPLLAQAFPRMVAVEKTASGSRMVVA